MFRKVIGLVGWAGAPVDMELALFDTILYPVKAHVHGFGFALAETVVGEVIGGGIVDLDWCSGLFMSHFFQYDSDVYCFSCHDVEAG